MKAALAWIVAALVTWLAYEYASQPELKIVALLTPFVLYMAVLRGRVHRLEDQLATREAELELTKPVAPHSVPAPSPSGFPAMAMAGSTQAARLPPRPVATHEHD